MVERLQAEYISSRRRQDPIGMADSQLIGPVPRSTPAEIARRQRRALPNDLLREASSRLGIISLIGAALWTVTPVMGHLFGEMSHAHPHRLPFLMPEAIAAGSVLVAVALFFYSRNRK